MSDGIQTDASRIGCAVTRIASTAYRTLPVVCLAGILALNACQSGQPGRAPAPAPPSASAPPLPDLGSAEPNSRFLIANWFVERFSGTAGAPELFRMRQLRKEAKEACFQAWRRDMLRKYSPVLGAEGEVRLTLQPSGLAALDKPSVIEAHLEALQDDIRRQIPLQADRVASTWFEEPPLEDYRADFRNWLADQSRVMPLPPRFRGQELQRSIRTALVAAGVKKQLKEALERSREWQKRGQTAQALDLLEQVLRQVPPKGGLQAIGDYETVQTVRQTLYTMPREAIAGALRDIDRKELAQARACVEKLGGAEETPGPCADAVSAAERRLSRSVRAWEDDRRLKEALEEYVGAIVELARLIARTRGRVWARDVALLAERNTAVAVVEAAAANIDSIQTYAPEQFYAYRFADANPLPQDPLPVSCAGLIVGDVRMELAQIAPRALQSLLALAEREVDVALHHGSAIALCTVGLQLYDLVGSRHATAEMTDLKTRLATRLQRSSAFVEKNVAARDLIIEPFSAVEQGLGMTFTKDIENLLRETLQASPTGRFVTIREAAEDMQPRDYRLTDGRIAAFKAEEPTETETIRNVSRWGPITAVPENEGTEQAYTQPLVEYAIHVKRIIRAAHVRFDCDLVHQNERRPIRVNQFFRKEFVQETVHPFNDVRTVRTEAAAALDELHEAQPKPTLINERVWTSGELLDWVRKQAQLLAVTRIVIAIDEYPFRLAREGETARAEKRPAAAANAWGLCFETLRYLDKEDGTEDLGPDLPETDVAEALQQAIADWKTQQKKLQTLRSEARRMMREAVAELLRDENRPEEKTAKP